MSLGNRILLHLSRNAKNFYKGTYQYGQQASQSYDLYKPKGNPSDLTIVFLYGGYWRAGSRQLYGFVGESFARHGYRVVVADYRLFPEVRHPDFVNDIADAINHYQKQFQAGISSKHIVFVAHSSGAQIATLLIYSSNYRKLLDHPETIRGVVTLGGALGFGRTNPLLKQIFPDTDPSNWQPIAAADTYKTPALVLAAKHDMTVAPWSSTKFAEKLRTNGVSVQSKLLFWHQHPTLVLALRHHKFCSGKIMRLTLQFLNDIQSAPVKTSEKDV